jgi:hypothetical protein
VIDDGDVEWVDEEEHGGEARHPVPVARSRRGHPDAAPGACLFYPSLPRTIAGVILRPFRCCLHCSQAHGESAAELTEVTNKVFFDIQIDGKPEGLRLLFLL